MGQASVLHGLPFPAFPPCLLHKCLENIGCQTQECQTLGCHTPRAAITILICCWKMGPEGGELQPGSVHIGDVPEDTPCSLKQDQGLVLSMSSHSKAKQSTSRCFCHSCGCSNFIKGSQVPADGGNQGLEKKTCCLYVMCPGIGLNITPGLSWSGNHNPDLMRLGGKA